MALILLILIGVLIGWLASILTRVEDVPGIRRDIAMGAAGALVGGLAVNKGVVLGGLSWLALATGIAAAVLVPAIYKFLQRRGSI